MIRCVGIVFTVLILTLPVGAQEASYLGFGLTNGVYVDYQTWSEIELTTGGKAVSDVEASGNALYRKLVNKAGVPLLGFTIQFEKVQDSVNISFAPIPGYPFFSQSPAPRLVHNRDRVLLDVLEEVGTGKKVFDTFEVSTDGKPLPDLPLPMHSLPGIVPETATLRIAGPQLAFVGYEGLPITEDQSLTSGSQVSFEAPNIGRFTLSAKPATGFLLEAIAEGNLVHFIVGDDSYVLRANDPIVDLPGSWYLWIRFEPADYAVALVAKPAQGEPAPLAIKLGKLEAGPDSTPHLPFELTNNSAKNILAYRIRFDCLDPATGKSYHMGHGTIRMGLAGTFNYLRPGQVARENMRVNMTRSSAAPVVTPHIDLVVFEDGSAWGPMTVDSSRQMLKAIQNSVYYRTRRND